ncbi:MAG: phasin family protein [Rhodocyclaceae bacterium]|nr:phasin family protein [Rhodocyclaceae bacterium]
MTKIVNPQQFADFSKAGVEALMAQATAAFARAERLAALNLNAGRSALEDGVSNTKALMAVKDVQELVSLQQGMAQPLVDKALAYARSVYAIAAEGQSEVTKAVESQVAELNKAFSKALDDASKSAPAGSEPAFAAAKSAIAAANSAYDSMSKAAKQASELAEANVSAVTKATVQAMNVKL